CAKYSYRGTEDW
nr:immunoglobulin heavy chain junction region [Mus musculus]